MQITINKVISIRLAEYLDNITEEISAAAKLLETDIVASEQFESDDSIVIYAGTAMRSLRGTVEALENLVEKLELAEEEDEYEEGSLADDSDLFTYPADEDTAAVLEDDASGGAVGFY